MSGPRPLPRPERALGWALAQETLLRSLQRLLVPIARLLLRNGLGFQAFAEMAKRAFVEAASGPDLGGPFRPTKARLALLTGLTRPEVRRLLEEREALPAAASSARIPAIIAGWATDPLFLDEEGRPLPLPERGAGRSFETLVRRFGADIPRATVLEELLLSGCVERRDGRLVLLDRRYRSTTGVDPLRYFGDATRRFGETIVHNLLGDGEPRLQREVWSRAIPAERVPELRARLRERLAAQVDESLALLDQEERLPPRPGQRTVGVGYYYFES
ncbi:MAG: DUF6502 family protein [Xanthomonadales bacterium]|nr:DUF6502 family protein [Xanthomonadales bacterium]